MPRKKRMHYGKEGKYFIPFRQKIDLVKMKKLGKKKVLIGSWQGPYLFVGYVDEEVGVEQDYGRKKCVIKGKDEQ